jgi:hypothetical protein
METIMRQIKAWTGGNGSLHWLLQVIADHATVMAAGI